MGLSQALLAFQKETVAAEPGGHHHTTSLILKIMCWMGLIFTIIVAIVGVFVSIGAAIGAQFFRNFETTWGDMIANLGPLFGLMIFFGFALAVVIMCLLLWWSNYVYLAWNQRRPNAVTQLNIYAIVAVVMGFPNFGNFSSSSATDTFTASAGGNWLYLIAGILLLIFGNMSNSQGQLSQAEAPVETA